MADKFVIISTDYPIGALLRVVTMEEGMKLGISNTLTDRIALGPIFYLNDSSPPGVEPERYIVIPWGTDGLLNLGSSENKIPEYKILYKEKVYWVRKDFVRNH